MRKIATILLAFILLVTGAIALQPAVSNCYADNDVLQNLDDEFSMCISGEANKLVSPDVATIWIAIENSDMDIEKSKNDNFEKYQQLIGALEEANISKENIILESFSSYPSYDYSNGRNFTGYFTSTTISVKTQVENIKSVIDTAIENGATQICNINYQISNIADVYNEVLAEAIENARTKAITLTGKEDIKILNIKEEYIYSNTSLFKAYAQELQNDALIGQLNIKAKVLVEFK